MIDILIFLLITYFSIGLLYLSVIAIPRFISLGNIIKEEIDLMIEAKKREVEYLKLKNKIKGEE